VILVVLLNAVWDEVELTARNSIVRFVASDWFSGPK